MLRLLSRVLGDPFELFRLCVLVFSLYELGGIAADLHAGYRRWYETLERVAGPYRLHELLRATIRLQLFQVVLKRRGWEELRILLVQAAAVACGACTWLI